MTFSKLISEEKVTTKRSSRNGSKIEKIVLHHWAGTRGGVERLVYSKDQASANYILLSTGKLIGSVPEEFRAWTSGSFEVDRNSITVEVQNTTLAPSWKVADIELEMIAKLLADVATRYSWKAIDSTRLRGHREFAATACPGPYLYPRIPSIIKRANEIWKGSSSNPSPSSSSTSVVSGEYKVKVTDGSLNIRKGAGTNYEIVGTIKDKGTYTIVETSGSWGKLKSGAGWIHLGYTSKATKTSSVSSASSSTILKKGAKGQQVKNLQSGLNKVFPAYSKLAIDGSFGLATENVVKEFQRRSGLVVDGVVGPKTIAALKKNGINL